MLFSQMDEGVLRRIRGWFFTGDDDTPKSKD
jgi:hypothetical protein